MAKAYRAGNLAFQARWHRAAAADLMEIGKTQEAHDRLQRAEVCEMAVRSNRQCSACGRALTDDESLHAGLGPECRRKGVAVA